MAAASGLLMVSGQFIDLQSRPCSGRAQPCHDGGMRPVLIPVMLAAGVAGAADLNADPSNYRARLGALTPGDTLHLSAGRYPLLTLSNLHGSPSAWITVTGPATGLPAIIDADSGPCCNTVEITGSSYLAVVNLTIDGHDIDGAFGLSAKGGLTNLVHHVRVEGCTFINHRGGQQHVAISTKTPTWGWIIRGNVIDGAGTGIYLGNSTGNDPFIGGIIENNVVKNPIGYCMEIKFQNPRPAVAGMPTQPITTIIRNNVFIKNDGPSPSGDRPNLLVGGFPASGAGSSDRYEIYGNLFFHNPRESLLQASGRVTIHDNVFVDAPTMSAISLRNHDLPLEQAWVYNNTIYRTASGIVFGASAPQGDAVVGNLVFSSNPISGPIANSRDNLTDSAANAASYVTAPSATLGQMDFYPRAGQCTGTALDESAFVRDTDHALDFNGSPKGQLLYRGAYAGSGQNPGWPLGDGLKARDGGPADAGLTDGGPMTDAGIDGGTPDGGGFDGGEPDAGGTSSLPGLAGGCSCDTGAGGTSSAALLAAALLIRRRTTAVVR